MALLKKGQYEDQYEAYVFANGQREAEETARRMQPYLRYSSDDRDEYPLEMGIDNNS